MESEVVESDLIFSGLVGMIDPERPEAAEAVRVAKEAGIRPIMITGDHQDTAEAIAKRLGIIDPNDTEDRVITGAELNELSDEEFQKVFKQYSVYARVSPEHKVRIVKAWQNAVSYTHLLYERRKELCHVDGYRLCFRPYGWSY